VDLMWIVAAWVLMASGYLYFEIILFPNIIQTKTFRYGWIRGLQGHSSVNII